MNIDDALKFTQSLIENHTKKPLNDSQILVLRGCLEGKSYKEIYNLYKIGEDYSKEIGSDLWKKLSAALKIKITKTNLRNVIEQHLPTEPQKISNSQISPKCNDEIRDFVGRDAAITDINNLVKEGRKIIVIQAAGGVGKTTLAKQYLTKFDLILPLEMAKDKETITAVESVVEEWLKQHFQEEPGREFGITLSRLKTQLQTRKVGVLIDNLEPALDEKGRFVEKHNGYTKLLGILADADVQSVTLITSRERLCDDRVNGIYHYPLSVLDVTAWKEFFTFYQIKIDPDSVKAIEEANQKVDEDDALKSLVETPAKSPLEAMHKVYGGNAKAMDILLGVMREDYDEDMAAYWQENCTLVETELKNLVESQFNRLQILDTKAYKLLCRLGCFRYQDVPRVSIDALLALLWDIPEEKRRDVIKSLRNRCLVEFEKGEYWLHPVIREQGIERLKASGEWEEVNRKAAEFWTESVKSVESIQDARKAFEAYYHYLEINNLEMAGTIIMFGRNHKFEEGEKLGHSFYRLGLLQNINTSIQRIIDNVKDKSILCQLYNILGDVNWLNGNISSAINYHMKSGYLANQVINNSLDKLPENILLLEGMKKNSLFNQGLCLLDMGDLEQALHYFYRAIASKTNLIKNTEIYHSTHARLRGEYLSQECGLYIAFINSCLGNHQEALEFLNEHNNKSLPIRSNNWSLGYSLLYISATYKNLGLTKDAFQFYDKAISFAKESNYTQVKAKALTGLAELYRIQDDFEKALFHHSESIELLNKIGAKCDLAEAYYQLGLTYQKMDETEKSHTNFNEAIRLFNEMEAPKQVEKVEKAKIQN